MQIIQYTYYVYKYIYDTTSFFYYLCVYGLLLLSDGYISFYTSFIQFFFFYFLHQCNLLQMKHKMPIAGSLRKIKGKRNLRINWYTYVYCTVYAHKNRCTSFLSFPLIIEAFVILLRCLFHPSTRVYKSIHNVCIVVCHCCHQALWNFIQSFNFRFVFVSLLASIFIPAFKHRQIECWTKDFCEKRLNFSKIFHKL